MENDTKLGEDGPLSMSDEEIAEALGRGETALVTNESSHPCPGCAGALRLQDRARDVWWCPTSRRWSDGTGKPLSKIETPKPVTRDEEDARELIADLRAAGCAFALEDGEPRLRYPSRMSAGLWARFESAGDCFRHVAMEAAICDESIDGEDSRAEGLQILQEDRADETAIVNPKAL